MNPLEEARNYLNDNRFEEFFATLKKYLEGRDKTLRDGVISLKTQYQNNERFYQLCRISYQEYSIQFSNINAAALSLLNEAEQLKHYTANNKKYLFSYKKIILLFIPILLVAGYFMIQHYRLPPNVEPLYTQPPIDTSKPIIIDTGKKSDITTIRDKPSPKPPSTPSKQESGSGKQAAVETLKSVSVIIHLNRAVQKDEVIMVGRQQANVIENINAYTKKIWVPIGRQVTIAIGAIDRQGTIKIGKCSESVYIKSDMKELSLFCEN